MRNRIIGVMTSTHSGGIEALNQALDGFEKDNPGREVYIKSIEHVHANNNHYFTMVVAYDYIKKEIPHG